MIPEATATVCGENIKVRITVIGEVPILNAVKAALLMQKIIKECDGSVTASFYTRYVEEVEG